MKLYHGSNQIIRKPDLSKGRKFLDFGSGFYLSDERSQAENRAKSAVLFFEEGQPTVSIFEWKKEQMPDLNIKYDIVIGATANDKVILVIDQYMAGQFDHLPNPKELVIQLFQPEKLSTQYLFSTAKSLQYLNFTDSYTI